MARVYLETSFISACVSGRTDAGSVLRRRLSEAWWRQRRREHQLFVSSEVRRELDHPLFPHRDAALNMLQDVSFIDLNAEVGVLANILVREFVMPSPANQGDAVHVAACCIHGIEVILSWNVRHLANLNKMVHLRRVCERLGLEAPIIVTPEMDPE